MLARSHTIYVHKIGCSVFQPAKCEQTIIHQHMLLKQESLIDGTAITILLCWHVLIADLLIFGYVN